MKMKCRILIVEDEKLTRITLEDTLKNAGYEVASAGDGLTGLDMIKEGDWDIVLLDLKLPGMDGISLLKEIRKTNPETSVIIITAYGTIESAVEAMKLGAYDYLTKPFNIHEITIKLDRLVELKNKIAENIALKAELFGHFQFGNLVGKSRKMRELIEQIKIVANSNATVMIIGETGTGKELVAETIHYNSPRRNGPLIKFSCISVPETLIETELFGHVKGAFSGAIRTKPGRFELAHRGTLFLDDIDDIPISIQPKLLRVLQNKEFERIGDERVIKVDVRVIAATKKDLSFMVEKNTFREDLYYRLNTITLRIPPLRERRTDIPLLVAHFIKKYSGDKERSFADEALAIMTKYNWPGNVRELEHFVEAMLITTREKTIQKEHLPKEFLKRVLLQSELKMDEIRNEFNLMEREVIIQCLKKFEGNISMAARSLNIPRSTLRDRIRRLNIKIPEDIK